MTVPTPESFPPPAPRRLVRRRDDKVVAGVCSGLAAYLRVDPTVVRLVVVAATLLGVGAPVLGYLVAWAVMPAD